MPHVYLDANWPDDPRICRGGWEVAGAHAMALCLVARSKFDGVVPVAELTERGVSLEVVAQLFELDLIEDPGRPLVFTISGVKAGGFGRRHIPNPIRRAVFLRDGHACVECGSPDDLSLDHIVPYSHGGPDTVENLRVLCRPCNSRRGNRV